MTLTNVGWVTATLHKVHYAPQTQQQDLSQTGPVSSLHRVWENVNTVLMEGERKASIYSLKHMSVNYTATNEIMSACMTTMLRLKSIQQDITQIKKFPFDHSDIVMTLNSGQYHQNENWSKWVNPPQTQASHYEHYGHHFSG